MGVADPSGRGYDYRGSFQYLRDGSSLTLEGVLFGEGRISAGSNGYRAYYYLKDHLGSIRAVIDSAGNVCERNDYYPFGLEHQREDYPQLVENRLKYNGKEKQYVGDLNFLDYGARLYDKDLARWFVLDAMQENYPSWSPYTYCLNNPLKFVDPTGAVVDDYFNSLGYYLGTDDAASDIVRIISREDWNKHKIVYADGTESISHKIGEKLSVKHSQSFLLNDESLRIYNHYNPTDLPVGKNEGKGKAGMSFRIHNEFISIGINLKENREEKISDHAHTIKNMFVHENQHYKDYKRMGKKAYSLSSKTYREVRAIRAQMNDETFKYVGDKYKQSLLQYEIEKYGIPLMPVQEIPLLPLFNPYK